MPTNLQLKLVHIAARQAGLDEAAYRLVLRNVGGVESSKLLDQAGFEDVLAVFEERGYRDAGKPETYWRDKVAMRGSFCGARVEHKIRELARQQKYALAGLCRRVSGERTERVDKLSPGEGHQLVELLKSVIEREAPAADPSADERSAAAPDATPVPAASAPARDVGDLFWGKKPWDVGASRLGAGRRR